MDPWGTTVADVLKNELAPGYDIRPTIAVALLDEFAPRCAKSWDWPAFSKVGHLGRRARAGTAIAPRPAVIDHTKRWHCLLSFFQSSYLRRTSPGHCHH